MPSTQHDRTPLVVGLGELLWDCFADSRRPGGAPANVAYQANQLGCRGIVCSRVGRDADGDELVRFLADRGLSTEHVQRDDDRPTGRVTVDTSRAGHPNFVIHEDVAWDALAFDEPTAELMRQAAAVCFGTLAQRADRSRETVRRCLDETAEACLRVYDVNLRQDWYTRDRIEASLERADLVKLNHEEAVTIDELLELRVGEDTAFAEAIRERFDVAVVCVTRAERGCLVIGDGEAYDVPGRTVQVVDAVGAGDAFTAALIATRLEGWPLEASVRFANEVGALVATRAGAMPELADELAELRARFRP